MYDKLFVHVMTHHVIWACAIADWVFVQVAEARQRHQLEREEIQRDNAQERRRLAQEDRQAAAERVHTTSTALQHGHTPGLCTSKLRQLTPCLRSLHCC